MGKGGEGVRVSVELMKDLASVTVAIRGASWSSASDNTTARERRWSTINRKDAETQRSPLVRIPRERKRKNPRGACVEMVAPPGVPGPGKARDVPLRCIRSETV